MRLREFVYEVFAPADPIRDTTRASRLNIFENHILPVECDWRREQGCAERMERITQSACRRAGGVLGQLRDLRLLKTLTPDTEEVQSYH